MDATKYKTRRESLLAWMEHRSEADILSVVGSIAMMALLFRPGTLLGAIACSAGGLILGLHLRGLRLRRIFRHAKSDTRKGRPRIGG